ncbi:hypothetical protein LPU83_pLPU83c_0393 (plasmid) [Rhizobium favelukesii]|uniref:Uncharacterized protein n=1 Tax=Rhizobium favelukesii TaxID=348824 RepID=W6RL23_9HYPH|nr:hypothetical protein LPU83_pLPU83c_0393 [Rhizobium favelukesii]
MLTEQSACDKKGEIEHQQQYDGSRSTGHSTPKMMDLSDP